MATITSYGNRFLNNPSEYGNNYGIPTFSELTLFIGGATLQPGETVTAARFYIELANGLKVYSPEIAYNGTGDVTYNFGKIQQNWIKPFGSTGSNYVAAGFEVKSNIQNGEVNGIPYYFFGWYGVGCFTLEYSVPEINYYNVKRIEPTTYCEHELEASISPLSTDPALKNAMYYLFQKMISGLWTDIGVQETFTGSYNYLTYNDSGPYDDEISYQTRVILSDKFNTVYAYDTLPTILIPLSIGKFGIGLGKAIENALAALDMEGPFYRKNVLQPTIYKRKESDPDPDGMETGDLLVIYNDSVSFSSLNFPQEFGTGFVWSQIGTWPTEFFYWTALQSTSNTIIESIQCSAFKGSAYPTIMFDGNTNWDNQVMFPLDACPIEMIIKLKGKVQFNSFTLHGWAQGHEIKNSPKSMAIFGSNDGSSWDSLYDNVAMTDSYGTSITESMSNSGNYYEYLKIVLRLNQDNNALTSDGSGGYLATMIAFRELTFNASGERYV